MADRAITALTKASVLTDEDLFVLSQSNQAKSAEWQLIIRYLTTALDGHGGIQSIVKTGTSGLVDTYTITMADQTTSTFTVTNGKAIESVSKTAAVSPSLTDTYTITFNDDTTYTFTVENGKAISSIKDYWAVSDSNTTVPTVWYDSIRTMTTTNRYLWHYLKITFNDETVLQTDKSVVGVYGDTGQAWHVYIKYSSQLPTTDAELSDTPDSWIGAYAGTLDEEDLHYTDYAWYQYKGAKGDTGDASAITSQSVQYQESTSGITIPEGTWTDNIPEIIAGNYLWTRITLNFNDNTTVNAYSVSRKGLDGSGAVSTVNSKSPASNGNVSLEAADIQANDSNSIQAHLTLDEQNISDLSAAIGDIDDLDSGFTATDLVGAANELKNTLNTVEETAENKVLYLTGVIVSATTGDIVSLSNAAITADHVLAECVWTNPAAITTDVTWTTTAEGSLTINGTCTTQTTANIVLVKKDN